MEQEYILRVVQRAGEKAVKCLKSQRQTKSEDLLLRWPEERGRECPERWEMLSCAQGSGNAGIPHSCQGMWEHS